MKVDKDGMKATVASNVLMAQCMPAMNMCDNLEAQLAGMKTMGEVTDIKCE